MIFMAGFFKQKTTLIILAALFILFAVLSLLSDGYYGGADNITHYLISHYAFKHPHLFLNAWGRPLYTILSAPFAQFGLLGVKMLNILLGLSTAWLAFRIAEMLKLKPAFLSLLFVCFTPLYFMMMPTALTEILFSFVLVLSVFLFICGNYIASAFVISFLPFARTEGFILLPLFFLAFLWIKQYKAIPFLAAGVIIFSFLGAFYYKDIFWVFTQFPYPVTYHHPIYNKTGSLWHFLESRDYTLGLPLEILFVAGMIGMIRDLFTRDKTILHRVYLLGILVLAPFLLYFAFHSVLFWKAMGGSMGLDRVLAAVMPLAALIALKGYGSLETVIGKNRYIRVGFLAVVLIAVVILPFTKNPIPFPLSPEEKSIREAASWIKASPYSGRLLFYTDNNVPYYVGADPWQKNPADCYLFGDAKYLDTIPAGSLLVWDAHFGANESKVPLDSLLGNQRQQLVSYFRPDKPWITFGGYNYECYITLTRDPGVNSGKVPGQASDNYAIRDSLTEILDAKNSLDTLFFQSFDESGEGWDQNLLSWNIVHRGRCSFIMDGRTEFSPGLYITAAAFPKDIVDLLSPGIRASAYIYLPELPSKINTLLVISFEHKNKPYSYTAINLNEQKLRPGRWNRVSLSSPIPAFKSPDDMLKVYIWNPGKQLFYLDDFRVEVVKFY
jgi:ABC-type cobalt transport system substrate-binding protein